jgi:chemotaxis protein CheC
MHVKSVELSAIEQDALAELANMGVSRAATNLAKMLGKEVLLSVPAVQIISREAAAQFVGQSDAFSLVAVQQSFEGPFSGRALLIFPEARSLELVRLILGDKLTIKDIIDLEHEVLGETGNIVLNGCLATIANVLRRTMTTSLPSVVRGNGAALFVESGGDDNAVLFLYINFTIKQRDLPGFVALLMDSSAIVTLKGIVDNFIKCVER